MVFHWWSVITITVLRAFLVEKNHLRLHRFEDESEVTRVELRVNVYAAGGEGSAGVIDVSLSLIVDTTAVMQCSGRPLRTRTARTSFADTLVQHHPTTLHLRRRR